MSEARDAVRLALTTAPDAESAERIVRALLDEGLVACGNIVPGVTSLYWWNGAVQRDAEVLVILKTTASASRRLVERLPSLHPYEVPELLLVPVDGGHGAYLEWVAASIAALRGGPR